MTKARQLLGLLLAATVVVWLSAVPTAEASDSERWLLTGASSVPISYWQGLTSAPDEEQIYFSGIFEGLWQTTSQLRQTAGIPSAIPPEVKQAEGYNHIGDPTWDDGEGGRVLLPLECYTPGVGNTCGTGAFGVADPATLAFRYYVRLDPAEISKAMWAETSPDGSLIWTSSGDDLLAYRASEVSFANRAPAGPLLQPARRLRGAVPPTGVTGAVFRGGELLLAGEKGGSYQVWAVDTDTGRRDLELEIGICGESEGLDVVPTLGGEFHWLIAPFDPGCEPTFGPTSALLHFAPTSTQQRLEVEVADIDVGTLPGKVRAKVRAARKGQPLNRAQVSFGGATAHTDKRGIATVSTTLELPGWFRALARWDQYSGASELAAVGVPPLAPGYDLPFDTAVDGSASAKKKQKQKGRKIVVEVKVKAKENLEAKATGKIKVNPTYKLKPQTKSVASGKNKTLKLKPKKSKHAKKIAKALKRGRKATAKLEVKLSDEAGNKKATKLKVKLKH